VFYVWVSLLVFVFWNVCACVWVLSVCVCVCLCVCVCVCLEIASVIYMCLFVCLKSASVCVSKVRVDDFFIVSTGWINQLLSWEGFEPLARLTYTTYLVHVTVIAVLIVKQSNTVSLSNLFVSFCFKATMTTDY
jgi:peptidoglycan/LPS O-acetylase OafA/YrhL